MAAFMLSARTMIFDGWECHGFEMGGIRALTSVTPKCLFPSYRRSPGPKEWQFFSVDFSPSFDL